MKKSLSCLEQLLSTDVTKETQVLCALKPPQHLTHPSLIALPQNTQTGLYICLFLQKTIQTHPEQPAYLKELKVSLPHQIGETWP